MRYLQLSPRDPSTPLGMTAVLRDGILFLSLHVPILNHLIKID
jgi:hypothetical protein